MKNARECLVSNAKAVFRDDFNAAEINTDEWTISTSGGMSVSIGSGSLTITTGTTPGAEGIITSKRAYKLSVSAYIIGYVTQRIANQEFLFQLISADGNDGVGWIWAGTGASGGVVFTKNNGIASQSTASNIQSTTSAALLEISAYLDKSVFITMPLTDTINQRSFTLVTNCPNPEKDYRIQLIARNTGTAASSTNFVIDAVSLINVEESYATILAGRGSYIVHNAIPIIGATRNYIVFYTDSTSPLGANGTFSGTSRNLLNPGMSGSFRACATADQPGTLNIQQSRDGSTWRTIATTAVTAGVTATLEAKVFMQQLRVQYVNGATAQGSFELTSCIVTN